MSEETTDHRKRRLTQLGEAIDALLDDGWYYMLILGKPGDDDTVNLVSNIPPKYADQALQAMGGVLRKRQAKGQKPTEI
jgi:hypothetical protein